MNLDNASLDYQLVPSRFRPSVNKRLIICCDGTWNEPSDSPTSQHATNVFKLSQAIPAVDRYGVHQSVYYKRGIGTGNQIDRVLGGAMGAGIDEDIQNAYLFLAMNYQPGDEIYLFGFSRGAYTVRSLAGFIYTAGLLKPQELRSAAGVAQIDRVRLNNRLDEAYQLYRSERIKPDSEQAKAFREPEPLNFGQVPIQLLCCWDTVGSLGIPDFLPGVPFNEAFNRRYRFHDHKLCAKIKYALHAVALDEKRFAFNVTPMEVPADQNSHLEQVLFPGDHGCVGGGTEATRRLANAALQWVVDRIDAIPELGLQVDVTKMGEEIGEDGKLVTQALDPIVNSDPLHLKALWASMGILSRGFKRDIPALSEAAIAWLANHCDDSAAQLIQLQQRQQAAMQAAHRVAASDRKPRPQVKYDLHESAKIRLLDAQTAYEPDSLGEYFEAIWGLDRDRVFQMLRSQTAVMF